MRNHHSARVCLILILVKDGIMKRQGLLGYLLDGLVDVFLVSSPSQAHSDYAACTDPAITGEIAESRRPCW